MDVRLLAAEGLEKDLAAAWEAADYPRAETIARELAGVREAALGLDHFSVADALSEAAEACRRQKNAEAALPLLERALAIENRAFGSDHERTATAEHRLANILTILANFDRALPLYEHAASVIEKTVGPEHARLAVALGGHGTALRLKGEGERAEPLLVRALKILDANKAESQTLMQALEELASVYAQRHAFDRAEPLLSRIVLLIEAGPDKSDLITALLNLAQCAGDAGHGERACQAAQRAVTVSEEKHGGRLNVETAQACNALAEASERTGLLTDALKAYERVLGIFERTLKADHPQLGIAMLNVLTLQLRVGITPRVDPLAIRAEAIFVKTFGRDHPHTQRLLAALADIYAATKK